MKVLILGAGSKISKPLFSSLKNSEEIQPIWVSSKPQPIWFEEGVWLNASYTNKEDFTILIEEHMPQYVVNLNAFTDVDGCEEDKMLAMFLNYELPDMLSEVCELNDIGFIHISTDYIFSGKRGLCEINDEPSDKNLNWYGITKKDGETAVLERFGCVIRTNFIYGNPEAKSFVSWVLDSLSEKKEIRIAYDQFSNPAHLQDVANVIVICILKNIKGVVHTGGKDWQSRWELAQVIALSKGVPSRVYSEYLKPVDSLTLNQKAIRPKFAGLGITKSEIILDYSFRGIYDVLLEESSFREDENFEENPNYQIFKKLIFVLKNIDNGVRKKGIFEIKKMDYGTISISINSELYFVSIEIGKGSYSGLIYEMDKEKELAYKLITGDLYNDSSIIYFLKEMNELFLEIDYHK